MPKHRLSKETTLDVHIEENKNAWEVRAIVAQKTRRGHQEYLIDWKPHSKTGESFERTWLKDKHIADSVLEKWERRKEERKKRQASEAHQPTAEVATQATESQDSQPPRPANRRHLQKLDTVRDVESEEGAERSSPPAKRPRLSTSLDSSLEPVLSAVSGATPESPDEESVEPAGHHFVVDLLEKPPGFDPTEYLSVTNSQSTGTQDSSQRVSELESQDQVIAVSQPSAQVTEIADSQDFGDESSLNISSLSFGHLAPLGQPNNAEDSRDSATSAVGKATQASDNIGEGQDLAKRIIPDSVETASDIPSHQPEGRVSQSYTPVRRQRGFQPTPPPQAWIIHTQPTSTPHFLTQPNFTSLSAHEGSGNTESAIAPTEEQDSASFKADLPCTSQLAEEGLIPSSRISEAAQVVSQPFLQDSGPGTSLETRALPNVTMSHAESREPSATAGQARMSTADYFLSQLEDDGSSAPGSPLRSQLGGVSPATASQSHEPGPWTLGAFASGHALPDSGPIFRSQPHVSAAETLGALAEGLFSDSPSLEPSHTEPPITVSPADISRPIEIERTMTLLPSLTEREALSSAPQQMSSHSFTLGQVPQVTVDSSPSSGQDTSSGMQLVTLPFPARLREMYAQQLKSRSRFISNFMASGTDVEPEEAQAGTNDLDEVRDLFNVLQNICDYPPDLLETSLTNIPPIDQVKYAVDANSKFHFINELLGGIRKFTDVLIVANSDLLSLLYQVVDSLGLACTCPKLGKAKGSIQDSASQVQVTIACPADLASVSLSTFDVIIGYDASLEKPDVSQALEQSIIAAPAQLILKLVTTHTLEHIKAIMTEANGSLEDYQKIVFATAAARKWILNPPHGFPEPHEAAKIFYDFLNKDTEVLNWEPTPIPDDCFDTFLALPSTQWGREPSIQSDGGRKRKLDDDADAESKRMRFADTSAMAEARAPPVTDEVRELLQNVGFTPGMVAENELQINVPLSALDKLAQERAKLFHVAEASDLEGEYKSVITRQETQIKELEKSHAKYYKHMRRAISDRTEFEKQVQKAEAAANTKVEAIEKASTKDRQKISDLEAIVARLTADAAVEVTEKALQEKTKEAENYAKRLANSQQTEEYIRNLYQEGSTTASALNSENNKLKGENEKLQEAASANRVRIHEIQNENTTVHLRNENMVLNTRVKDLEASVGRVQEELRQARNGRRETRNASQPPCSPRMGINSPRPGRVGLGTGSVSRDASPAPASAMFPMDVPVMSGGPAGIQFTNPHEGNRRWGNGL